MIFDLLFLIFFVVLLNWNIGIYNLSVQEKGRTKYILVCLNIFISIIIAGLAILY